MGRYAALFCWVSVIVETLLLQPALLRPSHAALHCTATALYTYQRAYSTVRNVVSSLVRSVPLRAQNLRAAAYYLSKTEIKFDLVSAINELNKQIRLEFDFVR
jgi:hypothetical protein